MDLASVCVGSHYVRLYSSSHFNAISDHQISCSPQDSQWPLQQRTSIPLLFIQSWANYVMSSVPSASVSDFHSIQHSLILHVELGNRSPGDSPQETQTK
jgi:hypothetical protein